MGIQTRKQLITFQLRAYRGFSEADLKGKKLPELEKIFKNSVGR